LAVLEAVASVAIVRLLAKRRPDLVPDSLRALASVAVRGALTTVLPLAIALSGCGYRGIDDTVFGAAAQEAGRPPRDSILDLSQGEVGLAMSIFILFGLGFIAGRSWERLLGEGRRALPR